MATLTLNLPVNAYIPNSSLPNNLTTTNSRHFAFKLSRTNRSLPVTCAIAQPEARPVVSPGEETTTTSTSTATKVAEVGERWKEIHGQTNWAGMLDPMDPLLRSEIIRYGEMTQACYGGFNSDPYSKLCGSCKYPPKSFFQDLGMGHMGYEVSSYIYSSNTSELIPKFFIRSLKPDGPWNQRVNWIGYVAVSNDETTARLGRRDITIAWRGTITKLEWMADLITFLKPVSAENLASPDPKIEVMAGFLHVYTDKDQNCRYSQFSAREQVMAEVARLMKIYGGKGEEVSITIVGHSLGSALAILNAYDIAESKLNVVKEKQIVHVSMFSFSGPRLGNTLFKKRLETLGVKVLRVFNIHDKVPTVPGLFFNENNFLSELVGDWVTWFYSHVGVKLGLDHKISPYVKETLDVADLHNLEHLLHLVDGYHGEGKNFELTSGRDKALVNKEADILLDEHLIPPYWQQKENKGLVKNVKGEWELPEEDDLEDHLSQGEVEHHLQKLGLA